MQDVQSPRPRQHATNQGRRTKPKPPILTTRSEPMAAHIADAVFPAEDDDDDDLNSLSTSSSLLPTDTTILEPLLSSVTVAVPAPSSASLHSDRKPLFQRLWTDEDEIELLRGFLHFTSQRGGVTNPDISLFYDQIKSKLQLDFNKNQLVEKLRRLKKKFRNAFIRISSGKGLSLKSPHDQATFEISRKIWSNSIVIIGNLNNNGCGADLNVDNDDEIVRGHSIVGSVNPGFSLNPNPVSDIKSEDLCRITTPLMGMSFSSKSRKGLRLPDKLSSAIRVEERNNLKLGGDRNSVMLNNSVNNVYNLMNMGVPGTSIVSAGNNGNSVGGSIEEMVRSCSAPVFKELGGGVLYGGGLNIGSIGGIATALNPSPFGLGEIGSDRDDRWRKQQIMELEVFSKRLELVQAQIKAALEELLSKGR